MTVSIRPAGNHARIGVLVLLIALLTGTPARAQQEGLLQINDEVHHFLKKQQALGHLPEAFLLHQPLSAYEARRYLDSLLVYAARLDPAGRRRLARLRGTLPHPGAAWVNERVPWLYRNGENLFSAEGEDFRLVFDPLLYMTLGYARQSDKAGQEPWETTWRNTRGVRAAGHVDIGGPLIFFEARMTENVERPLRTPGGEPPRLGRVQFDADAGQYDYFQATGVVGLYSEHFEVRFGRQRNRWGFGPGSVILSNYGPVYDQLQIRTNVWRLQYVNLFTRFSDVTTPRGPNRILPRRYGAFHSLAVNLPGRVQLQVFESVIFANDTTGDGRRQGFDLAYLNPIIFYRAVEHSLGSPDNVLLGGGVSWGITPGLKVYGQLMLDELRVSEIGNGWWANKWAWLLGAYWAEPLGLEGLTARLEYARLRPYVYAHRQPATAYLHYGDVLGHPAGPNSIDWALSVDYRPIPRLHLALNTAFTLRGRNAVGRNYGGDATEPYATRVADRDVEILQGIRQDVFLVEGQIGYELLPQLYVGASLRTKAVDDALRGLDRYVWPSIMLRWGLPFESLRY